MVQTLQPALKLLVNNRDATGDFSPYLTNLIFVDHIQGEPDGLELDLEDVDQRWIQGWYPRKGATVQAWLGYFEQPLLACGTFQVDEVELDGPPDKVKIRAVSTKVTSAMRTPRSKGYDGTSLQAVASEVAARHGLTVVGTIPDIRWRRITQHHESDLGLLQRLALEQGLVFTVKGSDLVFHDVASLEAQTSIRIITRADVKTYRFRDKPVPGKGGAEYWDPETKTVWGHEVDSPPDLDGLGMPLADATRTKRRTESKAHSTRAAKSALLVSKSHEREGTLALQGNTILVAGANLELKGWGVLDGLWQVKAATHRVDRSSGYTTEIEVRYVSA